MKHILNDLSNEEKNSIREQHTGGMKVMTENFSKLLNAKLGDAKPLVNEAEEEEDMDELIDVSVEVENPECWEEVKTSDGKPKRRRRRNSSCYHKYKTKGPKQSHYGSRMPGM